jgi:type I restriction-modification system DNA methylase subunit/REP element-mobilizing transposase RayT
MPIPDAVSQLVDQFHRQIRTYQSAEYNEAQVRHDFIEPFFAAMGWDVYNKQGHAFAYKDVIYEDSIKVSGATKAPDYAFRIGGIRKFFVEAKKPSVNLKDEISPAYQLRRYAWSAHLPLSILTDFEEFAVYDCRPRPDKSDKASTGRILMLTYQDYAAHWDEIANIFSPQSILKGSFDQYAEAATGKRGTAEVDDAFLAEIEHWRELLVHNLALRNPTLGQRDLNYAVQLTIDRLIFLRICEDRGIEFYGQLQALLNGGDTYARLFQLFRKADERYNSGLFHFRTERDQADIPDTLTPSLLVDDKTLKEIIGKLYYPDSPYEFSVLPADILGQVYERFLGKVIRLTPAHRAVVEDKPEVKKAGGVFYTPTFIVDYIVKNTLGKLLEGKKPGWVGFGRGTPIRVLDMACGSGSFLLGAYQYLLDWYLEGYTREAEKWSRGSVPRLYPVPSPDGVQWKLTTSERKRILLDHIYGVDIDPQAVEVTKLSLLLKVLEGESDESIGKQLSMFRQRALPDMGGNIKCGNSLIGPDFYDLKKTQASLPGFDLEEQYRINAFDWKKEFPAVFEIPSRSFWLVTFVTHNSRVSERMVTYGVKAGKPLIFDSSDRLLIACYIVDVCRAHSIPVVAWNVLPDHVHMILAAEDEHELDELVRKIKGASSYSFQRTHPQDELGHVWAQKYHHLLITDQRMLENAYTYVMNNHIKHADTWGQELVEAFEATQSLPNLYSDMAPSPDAPTRGLSPLLARASNPMATGNSASGAKISTISLKEIRDGLCVTPGEASQGKSGGFDVIIGNPPYVRQEGLKNDKKYYSMQYKAFSSTADIYVNFIEKGLCLLNHSGRFGMIVSNKWLRAAYGERLREFLGKKANLEQVIDLAGLPVFANATVRTIILICSLVVNKRSDQFQYLPPVSINDFQKIKTGQDLETIFNRSNALLPIPKIGRSGWSLSSNRSTIFIDHLQMKNTNLREYIRGKPLRGIITGLNKAFVIDKNIRDQLVADDPNCIEIIRPLVVGRNLHRYFIEYKDRYLIWTYIGVPINNYPAILHYLEPFEQQLQKRWDKGNHWWELRACDYYKRFGEPKIIYPDIATTCRFVLDTVGYFSINTTYFIPSNDLYLLGILNSKLANFYLSSVCAGLEGGGKIYLRFFGQYLEGFPIATKPLGSSEAHKLSSLVERMLTLHRLLFSANIPDDKTRLQRQIDITDHHIDALVYELYGLTNEEIKIIEDI